MTKTIVLGLYNLRSLHNVGSLLRSANGLGITEVATIGYTPSPQKRQNETRLPHVIARENRQITKTSLGAEKAITIKHFDTLLSSLSHYSKLGYNTVALEQSNASQDITSISVPDKVFIVVGNEPDGIPEFDLALFDSIVEIPMFGSKESFNVSVAGAIALYQLRYIANQAT